RALGDALLVSDLPLPSPRGLPPRPGSLGSFRRLPRAQAGLRGRRGGRLAPVPAAGPGRVGGPWLRAAAPAPAERLRLSAQPRIPAGFPAARAAGPRRPRARPADRPRRGLPRSAGAGELGTHVSGMEELTQADRVEQPRAHVLHLAAGTHSQRLRRPLD